MTTLNDNRYLTKSMYINATPKTPDMACGYKVYDLDDLQAYNEIGDSQNGIPLVCLLITSLQTKQKRNHKAFFGGGVFGF
jgi:hypothetical protein